MGRCCIEYTTTPSVQIMGWREAGDEWLCLPGHMGWTWAFIKPDNVAQMKVTPRDVSPADFAPSEIVSILLLQCM